MVGWFRHFRPPPPPLVLFCFRRPPLFFSLALSGFARFGPGLPVLVFAPSLFLCVPLFASWLSNFHLMFIFTSSSFPFNFIFISLSGPQFSHPPAGGCVCEPSEKMKNFYLRFSNVPSGFVYIIPVQAGGCRAQWKLHPTKLSTCAGSRV